MRDRRMALIRTTVSKLAYEQIDSEFELIYLPIAQTVVRRITPSTPRLIKPCR